VEILFDKWSEDGRRKAEEFQLFRDISEAFKPFGKKEDLQILFYKCLQLHHNGNFFR
jgi:hypothetical protein